MMTPTEAEAARVLAEAQRAAAAVRAQPVEAVDPITAAAGQFAHAGAQYAYLNSTLLILVMLVMACGLVLTAVCVLEYLRRKPAICAVDRAVSRKVPVAGKVN